MKKIILVILLLTFKISFAQTGWFWQNPTPQGENIIEVKFLDANIAIATTRGNSILRSTDKGATWKVKNAVPLEINHICELHSINVINPTTVLVMHSSINLVTYDSYKNKILKSTDAGETWSVTAVPQMNYLNSFSVKFINANTGFLKGKTEQNPEVYKTTNAGGAWSRLSINGNDSLTNFFFLNENTGWIGSLRDKNFYKTTNGSISWATGTISIPTMQTFEHWSHSFFINENTGWLSGLYPGSYKTTNGGANWTSVGFSFNNGNLFFINELTGYAYGSYVYKTTNGGMNWQEILDQQDHLGFALASNNLNGIAVGKYGRLLTTSNAGANWVNKRTSITPYLFSYPDNFEDIFFLNENTGWCATWSNGAYKTTNGGTNWVREVIGGTADKIKFTNANTGIAAGTGSIKRTSNGGANWITVPFDNFYWDFPYFKNDTACIILQESQFGRNLIRSTNGGTNWISHSTAYQLDGKLHFINSRLVFSGYGAAVHRSFDGGATWQFLYQFWDSPIYNLNFINENTGFVSSDSGIYKTTNAGQSFARKIYLAPSTRIESFQFINDMTGWAASGYGGLGVLLKTTDRGETWKQSANTDNLQLNSVFFINENTGWICGNNEVIIKTTTGGTIGIQQISTTVPDKFYLEQNYPNPFNPNTVISFQLPAAGFVKLKVFDLLGREVANLVNENLSAGSYKYDFNASSLPSGIYFYKLETDNFSETRKMVLVK